LYSMCLSTSVSLSPTSIFAIDYLLVYLYVRLLVINSLLSACLLCLYLLSCITTLAYFSLLVMDSLYNGLVSCLLVSYVFIYLSCLPNLANFFACPQWVIFLAVILLIKNNSRKNDDPFLSTLPPFLPVCLSSLCAADGNNAAKTSSLMSVPQLFFLPLYR